MVLKTGYIGKWIKSTLEVSKSGDGKGWRRSVGRTV
jgi:hypothetical protein